MVTGLILGWASSCKNPDSLFEEYIVKGGFSYPGRPMDAVAYPGNKQIEISWRNGDPKVVKVRYSWNNDTKSVEDAVESGATVIRRLLENMDENTYTFKIRTYDAEGNVSVPVEVTGTVYGETYERSLANRPAKSVLYDVDEGNLVIEWSNVDATETGLILEYTDGDDNIQTLPVPPSETTTAIPYFKAGSPIFCTTMYKPESEAINTFHAPTVMLSYSADLTKKMNNTGPTFLLGAEAHHARFYLALGWEANNEAKINGNVDKASAFPYYLCFITAPNYAPALESITNAKLWQSIDLEPGKYEFQVRYHGALPAPYDNGTVYLVASWDEDGELPNIEGIEQDEKSSCLLVPKTTPTGSNIWLTLKFELTKKSLVKIGFVASLTGQLQIYFTEVKLFGYF